MQTENMNERMEEDQNINETSTPETNEESTDQQPQSNNRAEVELKEMKDKYVRLFAEFDNYKKRTAREFVEMRQTAGKEIISSLLVVLDDMDRAEEQFSKTDDNASLKEGTLLIFNKLRKILESQGLKAMDTLHTEFDVEKDEAISEVPVEDKKLKGKVIAEVQKGYLLNEKIIRFAKVVVGK